MIRVLILASVLVILWSAAPRAQGDQWLARDKALHVAAGTALGAGGYGAGALAFTSTRSRIGSGLVLALGTGAAKEWHDRSGQGTASWRDFGADSLGAVAGITIAWLIDRARHPHRPASANDTAPYRRPQPRATWAPALATMPAPLSPR